MIKRKSLIACFTILIFAFMFFGVGCASFDIENSGTELMYNSNIQVKYNEQTSETDVVFYADIKNGTVYDMLKESFTFSTYKDGEFFKEETIYYKIFIAANASKEGNILQFSLPGKIDYVKYKVWNCEYSNFWDTYKLWIIGAIIIAVIGAIVYIVFMIVEDFDFNELWENIGYILLGLCIILIPFTYSLINGIWNWIYFAITIGSFASFFIIVLIAQSIKSIFD